MDTKQSCSGINGENGQQLKQRIRKDRKQRHSSLPIMQTLYHKSYIFFNNVPLRSNSRDVDPQSFLLEISYDQDTAQELVICKTAL